MADWLDEIEEKRRLEKKREEAGTARRIREWKESVDRREKLYESVRHLVEPIFDHLEAQVERAKKQGFLLGVHRTGVDHELQIYRFLGKVEFTKSIGTADSEITLYPKAEGLQIWFTRAQIRAGTRKNGAWLNEIQNYGGNLIHCVGTVRYENISDSDLSNVVKWLALGESQLPRFRNVIPYKSTWDINHPKKWWQRLFS